MFHGYDACPISTIYPETPIVGPPAKRGQSVVNNLKEAKEFAQAAMVVAQQNQEKYANIHR